MKNIPFRPRLYSLNLIRSDESAWARGQAWAIYGYTMCYRYTHDQKYLDMAEKIYNFIFNNPNLPEDLVPYWDFDAPNIPNEPRDASAAACTASALYELSTYIPGLYINSVPSSFPPLTC